ncbi:MAG: hypothetical protein ACR2NP_06245, partial [Pirellulaceae bacterium]
MMCQIITKQPGLSRFVLCVAASIMLFASPAFSRVANAQSAWRDQFSDSYYHDQETGDPQQGLESGDAGRAEQGEGEPRGNSESWESSGESAESESSEELPEWVPPGEPREVEAQFGDGFAFVSKDEEFELRFHVLTQIDFKFFNPGDQEPAA